MSHSEWRGDGYHSSLSFLCYNAWGSVFPLRMLHFYAYRFSNNTILGNSPVAFFTLEVKIHSQQGSRFQLDGCFLTQGLEPRSSYYTAVLAFFFSNVSPVLDLQHWVIGSGHNLMACLWPASSVQQVFRKFEMDGKRERSVARCQGP